MDEYTATEVAYKNGYNDGYAKGFAEGSQQNTCVIDKHSDTLLELADKIPIVEAEPIRHGRWLEKTKHFSLDSKNEEVFWWVDYCSECEYTTNHRHNYCPNCGAKMDGGSDNG